MNPPQHSQSLSQSPSEQPTKVQPVFRFEDRAPRILANAAGIPKKLQYKVAELGFRHLSRGRLDKAKIIFEGLVRLDPFDAYFQLAAGSVAQRQARWSDADAFYSAALKLNRCSVPAWANRGEVRLMVGRKAEGLADLKSAVAADRTGKDPAAIRARALLTASQRR